MKGMRDGSLWFSKWGAFNWAWRSEVWTLAVVLQFITGIKRLGAALWLGPLTLEFYLNLNWKQHVTIRKSAEGDSDED